MAKWSLYSMCWFLGLCKSSIKGWLNVQEQIKVGKDVDI